MCTTTLGHGCSLLLTPTLTPPHHIHPLVLQRPRRLPPPLLHGPPRGRVEPDGGGAPCREDVGAPPLQRRGRERRAGCDAVPGEGGGGRGGGGGRWGRAAAAAAGAAAAAAGDPHCRADQHGVYGHAGVQRARQGAGGGDGDAVGVRQDLCRDARHGDAPHTAAGQDGHAGEAGTTTQLPYAGQVDLRSVGRSVDGLVLRYV